MEKEPRAKFSNEQLKRANLAPDECFYLAAIPEDPAFWSDHDCVVFEAKLLEYDFFLKHGDFRVVETYEWYGDPSSVPQDELVEGTRKLVVLTPGAFDKVTLLARAKGGDK